MISYAVAVGAAAARAGIPAAIADAFQSDPVPDAPDPDELLVGDDCSSRGPAGDDVPLAEASS